MTRKPTYANGKYHGCTHMKKALRALDMLTKVNEWMWTNYNDYEEFRELWGAIDKLKCFIQSNLQ